MMTAKIILPKITEDQYRIIITALHTLEKQYPKNATELYKLTDLLQTYQQLVWHQQLQIGEIQ